MTIDTTAAATRGDTTTQPRSAPVAGWWRSAGTLAEVRWAAAATLLFLAGLTVDLAGGPAWLYWLLFLACYVAGGWEPGRAGLQELRHKRLDVDLLMVAAAIAAAAIGQVLDGGLLIVIFATSGALEAVATKRTEDSVRGLLDLTPDTATRVAAAGSGTSREETVQVVDLAVGDVILVRPGERIAADGAVLDGASEVDQATVTGEPLPVDKTTGDEVFAGTLNGTGALRVRVDRPATESVVARIAGLVEEAARTKAKTQLFIEKVEQRYSIGMVTATIALFAIPLLFGQAVTPTLLRAMTFMIVASPCAVVLATMPPLLAAIANAGRHGVLVKSAVVMEQLGATTQVALDKTGTLTRGTPHLAEIRLLAGTPFGRDEVLALAASAEHPSEHPLSAAVVSAARDRGLALTPVESFGATAGMGVTAAVDGHQVQLGTPTAFLDTTSSCDQAAQAEIDDLRQAGATAVVVVVDSAPVAVLSIVDQLRPEAVTAVEQLTRLTGRTPVLLTGDNAATAGQVAGLVGITQISADLLPDDKVTAVRELRAAGRWVTVVGDGINDAPALAAAHAGIAMGGAGSDLTLQTADAIVVRDDLIGHLPLPLGVAGHEGSTVIVGLNGLRLLRNAAWTRADLPTSGKTQTAEVSA